MTDRIDIPPKANFVEVDGTWLAKCGLGNETRTFPIQRICGRTPGGAVIVEVLRDNNALWTVILPWRGHFV